MSDVKDYSQLKERLDQIVEAVKLGSKASALIEEDINAKTAEELAAALAAEQEDAAEDSDNAPADEAAALAADQADAESVTEA